MRNVNGFGSYVLRISKQSHSLRLKNIVKSIKFHTIKHSWQDTRRKKKKLCVLCYLSTELNSHFIFSSIRPHTQLFCPTPHHAHPLMNQHHRSSQELSYFVAELFFYDFFLRRSEFIEKKIVCVREEKVFKRKRKRERKERAKFGRAS